MNTAVQFSLNTIYNADRSLHNQASIAMINATQQPDVVGDESIKHKALACIDTEAVLKVRKKYLGLWKS